MGSTTETPRARELGARLREARKAAGFSQEALAERLGRRHSHISRWETAKLEISEADVGAVLGVLGVTGTDRDELIELAKDAADPNYLTTGVDRQLAVLREYERSADLITNVQPMLIPGLMQTTDYARAIMIGAGATRGDADARIDFRVGRRDVLTRQDPVRYEAIIGEHALHYPPCPTSIAAEQLRELERLADLDNVTIRALPLTQGGYSPALEGPFVLIESAAFKPIVHLEHYRSSTTLTDGKDVRDYQSAADNLRQDAMSPAATKRLITQLANEMERRK